MSYQKKNVQRTSCLSTIMTSSADGFVCASTRQGRSLEKSIHLEVLTCLLVVCNVATLPQTYQRKQFQGLESFFDH